MKAIHVSMHSYISLKRYAMCNIMDKDHKNFNCSAIIYL